MAIITEQELSETRWKIKTVTPMGEPHPEDTLAGNYIMKFCGGKRKTFLEENGHTDFLLNHGWWEIDEENDILIVHNKGNAKLTRNFQILSYDSDLNQMVFKVIHNLLICSMYKSFDEFILEKILE